MIQASDRGGFPLALKSLLTVLLGLGVVAAGWAVHLLVGPDIGIPPFAWGLLLVFFCSVLGGLPAGIAGAVLATGLLKFFFVEPLHALEATFEDSVPLIAFALCSGAIVFLTWLMQRRAEVSLKVADENSQLADERLRRLNESETRIDQLNRLLDGLDASVWQANAALFQGKGSEFRFDFISAAASRITGYPIEQLREGTGLFEIIHPEDRERTLSTYAKNIQERKDFRIEFRINTADGSVAWVEDSVQVRTGERRGATLVRSITRDITSRKRFEQGLKIRAQAGELLELSLDPDAALQTLLPFIVPELADDCVVFTYGNDGRLAIARSLHAEQAHRATVERLQSHYKQHASGDSVIPVMLRGGKAVLMPEVTEETLQQASSNRSEFGLLKSLGSKSAMFVPLRCHGRNVGAMAWMSSQPLAVRRYDQAELSLAEDLGRRIALAFENARLYQASQQDVQARDKFLAVLGHELRNPLNAIANAVLLSHRRPDEESALKYREIIARQTRHMTKLIDDLLDVARVTGGRLILQKRTLDLRRLAADCIEAARPEIDKRFHQVRLTIAKEPVIVDGDPLRLDQLITNLIGNAVKYTPPGGRIEVDVREEGDVALLRVTDNGQGIPPDMIGRIFEPFTRADNSGGGVSGLGVGLALVKNIAELHGGRIAVESPASKGSVFTLRLPKLTSIGLAPQEPEEKAAPPAPRVLVVEDDRDNRETLGELLKSGGYDVVMASDGPTGVQMAELTKPLVAIVDIGLPGYDGYEVARRLRNHEKSPVLIALTGFGQPDDRRRAYEAGFDHHLVKPLNAEQLMALISKESHPEETTEVSDDKTPPEQAPPEPAPPPRAAASR